MKLNARFLATTLALVSGTFAARFGDSVCTTGNAVCISAIYDDQALEVEYTATRSGSSVGWIGVGQGTQMDGANMMVGWPTQSGDIVLSQRSTRSHAPPSTAATTFKAFKPDVGASSYNSSQTVLRWVFPVDADFAAADTPHIWATSTSAPSSSNPDASITRHNERGFFSLDLTKPLGANGVPESASADEEQQQGQEQEQAQLPAIRDLSLKPVRLFLAHMIFMSIAWFGVVPAGILVGRFGRTLIPSTWFRVHRALQVFAVVLIIIGFALGVSGTSSAGLPHFDNTHQRVGLAMFILVVIQAFGGQIGHLLNKKNIRLLNFAHILLGIVLFFGLSLWQVRTGLQVWLWRPPKAVADIVFPVLFGIYTAAWLLGLILLPKQLKSEKRQDKELVPLSATSSP